MTRFHDALKAELKAIRRPMEELASAAAISLDVLSGEAVLPRTQVCNVAAGLAFLRLDLEGQSPEVFRLRRILLEATGYPTEFPFFTPMKNLRIGWVPVLGLAVPQRNNPSEPEGFAAEVAVDAATLSGFKPAEVEWRRFSSWRVLVDAIAAGGVDISAALLLSHPVRAWRIEHMYTLDSGPRFSVRAIAALSSLGPPPASHQLLVNVLEGEVGESLAAEVLPWGVIDQKFGSLDDALRYLLEERSEAEKIRCLVADELLCEQAKSWYPSCFVEVPLTKQPPSLPLAIGIGPTAAPIKEALVESLQYLEKTNLVQFRANEYGLGNASASSLASPHRRSS